MENRKKITSFTDLIVWQKAHQLAILVYEITKTFPKEEKYSLVDQMKRSVISITSNIAEGFSRQGRKEKIQFYFVSKGSVTELENQLYLAKDVSYLSKVRFDQIMEVVIAVHKLLNAFIKSSESKFNITSPVPNTKI